MQAESAAAEERERLQRELDAHELAKSQLAQKEVEVQSVPHTLVAFDISSVCNIRTTSLLLGCVVGFRVDAFYEDPRV